jgi:hypothetical protein
MAVTMLARLMCFFPLRLDDPDRAFADDVLPKGIEAFELAFGFCSQEDQVGFLGGSVLGRVCYLRNDLSKEGRVASSTSSTRQLGQRAGEVLLCSLKAQLKLLNGAQGYLNGRMSSGRSS